MKSTAIHRVPVWATEPELPDPLSIGERILLVTGFALSVLITGVCGALLYSWASHIDWSAYIADMGQALQALGQVGGAKQ
jgi:hypothetical protein